MKDLIVLYQKLPWDRKLLWSAAALALAPLVLAYAMAESEPRGPRGEDLAQVDTHIPRGFVLVPIEIENYESLDSLLGRFGVVDLFQKGQVIARNVRILRAPLNPAKFAVLIPENHSKNLLKGGTSFSVVIKQAKAAGTEFVKPTPRARRSITFEGG